MSECPQDRLAVFEKIARKEFAFLETEYCFQVTTLKPENADRIVIQYRSESVYLMLHYGPPEYALDFSFGRLGIEDQEDAHGFTSGDLLYLDGTDNWSDYPGYSAYELSNLREFLPKLAQLLRECGHSCLRGDDTAFETMAIRRQEDCDRWHKGQERDRIASQAEIAWRDRDFGKVIALYSSIESNLTAVEEKRLEYAKSHSPGR